MDDKIFEFVDVIIGAGEMGKRVSKSLAVELSQCQGIKKTIPDIAINFSKDVPELITENDYIHELGGSGRQAQKAKEYYLAERQRIQNWLFNHLNNYKPKAVAVCGGLGGGVATGIVSLLLEDIFAWERAEQRINQNFKLGVYMVLTLPKQKEGAYRKRSAFLAVNDLIRDYLKPTDGQTTAKVLGCILVDNATCENLYGGGTSWDEINKGVVRALTNFFDLPYRNDIDWSAGYKKFDPNDLKVTLNYGSGFIDFRKAYIPNEIFQKYTNEKLLDTNTVRTASLICSSHDINSTNRYAALIGVPKKLYNDEKTDKKVLMTFIDELFRIINQKTKCSDLIISNYFSDSLECIQIDLLCTGLPLSQKILTMLGSIVKDIVKDRKKTKIHEVDMGILEDISMDTTEDKDVRGEDFTIQEIKRTSVIL